MSLNDNCGVIQFVFPAACGSIKVPAVLVNELPVCGTDSKRHSAQISILYTFPDQIKLLGNVASPELAARNIKQSTASMPFVEKK